MMMLCIGMLMSETGSFAISADTANDMLIIWLLTGLFFYVIAKGAEKDLIASVNDAYKTPEADEDGKESEERNIS